MQNNKTKLKIFLTLSCCLLLFILNFTIVFATTGINKQLAYQGVLKNDSGVKVSDGDYDIIFKIYDATSGGNLLWTGTHTVANGNAVTITDGVFSALLGSGTGNAMTLSFNDDSYYLGVKIDADAEMTPRKRIGAVGYAFNADTVDGLGFSTSTLSVGDIFYADSANTFQRLGVGANGQVLKLSGGIPSWTADLQGGGGSGAWATTTDNLAIYAVDISDVVIVGSNATTTTGNILEVVGNSLFDNINLISATSTGSFNVGNALGLNSEYFTDLTGTGLINSSGILTVDPNTFFALSDWYSTTTDALSEGSNNLYWTNNRFDTRLSATTTLPNITTLLGLQNASSTMLTVTNGAWFTDTIIARSIVPETHITYDLGAVGNKWDTAYIKKIKLGASSVDLTESGGSLQISGGITANNVQIGVTTTGEIDTSSGNLTLDSAGGTILIDDELNVTATTTLSAILDLDGNRIIGIATPINTTDGANKGYVDNYLNGLVWQSPMITSGSTTPPVSPSTDDRHTVGVSATGDWAGEDNKVATWEGSSWSFASSTSGWTAYVSNVGKQYSYNGTLWVEIGSDTNHNTLTGLQGGTTNEYFHLLETDYNALNHVNAQLTNLQTTGNPQFSGITVTDATTTNLHINNEDFTDLTGIGLVNYSNILNVSTTTFLTLSNWFATTTQTNISSLPMLSITESQISNLVHFTNNDFDIRLSATTTLPNLTTLLGLTSASTSQLTVTNGAWFTGGNVGIGLANPDELLHIAQAVDGASVGLLVENSQTNSGGSTNETAEIRFGFGGDNDVARIVARKQNDYSGGTASMNSQLVFHVDVEGSDDEIVYLKKDGFHFTSVNDGAKLAFENTPGGMASMGIYYLDSGSTLRSGLTFPGSDIVRLANRASNGVVEIRANTATGGSGGEVLVATFEDNKILLLTSGGNVGIGTTDPKAQFDFDGGNVRTQRYIDNDSNTNLGYGTFGAGNLTNAGGGDNGLRNVAIGWQSMYSNTTGYRNTAVGWQTMFDNTTGYENTAIGRAALNNNISGNQNTAIGKSSLFYNASGDNNVAIGYNTGLNIITGSNNIVIGNTADVPSDGDNQLNIGNVIYGDLSAGNIGIGTSTPSANFVVNGVVGQNLFQVATSTNQNILVINEDGNIGFGTAGAYSNLAIYTDKDASDDSDLVDWALLIQNPANDTGEELGIGFRTSTVQGSGNTPGAGITFERTGSNSVGGLNFKTSPILGELKTRMTIDKDGNVSIGTTTTSHLLHLEGVIPEIYLHGTAGNAFESGRIRFTEMTSGGSPTYKGGFVQFNGSANVFNIGVHELGNQTTGDDVNAISIARSTANVGIGDESPSYRFTVDHNSDGANVAYVNNSNAWTNGSADYAEYYYTVDTDLESGEVVCVDIERENAVKRCINPADGNLMGIISTSPAFLGNAPAEEQRENNPNYVIVAMLGQIPAKASNENGAIRPGDSLTSASKQGYIMRADAGAPTVGIALEKLESETGIIQVLISRRNKSITVAEVEEEVTERIANMEIEDEVNILISDAINNLDLDNEINNSITPKLAVLNSRIDEIKEKFTFNILEIEDILNTNVDTIKILSNEFIGIDDLENENGDTLTLEGETIIGRIINGLTKIWNIVIGNQEKIATLEERVNKLEIALNTLSTNSEVQPRFSENSDEQAISEVIEITEEEITITSELIIVELESDTATTTIDDINNEIQPQPSVEEEVATSTSESEIIESQYEDNLSFEEISDNTEPIVITSEPVVSTTTPTTSTITATSTKND